MIIFSQQDKRWYNETLGNTVFKIGRWGCLDSVLAMVRSFIYGSSITPLQVAKKLEFSASGNLKWESLKNIGLKLEERIRERNDADMVLHYKNPNHYVAIEVNNNHWVWMIGRYIPILGYKIADPWTGTIRYANVYKNNITGYAIISKLN